jgi:hypothetical protein
MMNIVEAQKREGYTNQLEFLAELVKRNDLLQFAPWYPSNNGSFHKWLKAVRLGKGAFTKINGAVPTISSTSDEFVEPIAFYQADSLVDDTLLKAAKDKKSVRDSEDVANTKGFLDDWLKQVIYSVDNKDGFQGFAQRRAAIDSKIVWSGGGTTGDQSSLYLLEFGKEGFNFRYAPGMAPGINTEDRGRHYIDVPTGTGKMWAWIRHFEISGGMEIKNDKALQRMCNIPVTGSSLPHATFIKMKNQLPNIGKDAVAFANRTIHAIVETLAYEKSNAAYSIQDIEGFGPVTRFVGIPVMFMEAITDTESVIS